MNLKSLNSIAIVLNVDSFIFTCRRDKKKLKVIFLPHFIFKRKIVDGHKQYVVCQTLVLIIIRQ